MPEMKVLIADDETLARIGIRHLIRWEDYHLSVVGEAEDGEQVLAMMEKFHPDIVLMDISMPVLNGISVLKEIKKRRLSCKVIVLSCHDEFNLVKEALINGASDYILKNALDSENLLEALERVKKEILEERNTQGIFGLLEKDASSVGSAFRKTLLTNLLDGKNIPANIQQIVSVKPNNLYCAVFAIRGYEKVRRRYKNQDTALMTESLISIFDQALSDHPEHEVFEEKENRYVLLMSFSEINHGDRTSRMINDKVMQLISLAKTYINLDMYAGIGIKRDGYHQLSLSYREALMAMSRGFCFKNQLIFQYQTTPKAEKTPYISSYGTIENEIRKMSLQRKYDEVQQTVRLYFSQMRKLPVISSAHIKDFMVEITHIIMLNEEIEDSSLPDRVAESDSLDEIEDLFFHQLFGNKVTSSDYGYLSKHVINYINANYTKPISLKTIANALQISENHISRVFNKSVGVSIPDYINNVRIEKAKDLLGNTNGKIYEIAEQVGFSSVAYFSTVFKKSQNCTPFEYKNQVGKAPQQR